MKKDFNSIKEDMMTESDVRKWVRDELGLMAYWIEHARGGTVGMADCLVAASCGLVPVELKVGALREKESGTWWKVNLRPAQVQIGDRLWRQGIETMILVGNSYADEVWMMPWRAIETSEGGWAKMVGPVENGTQLSGHLQFWGGR